MTIGVRLPEDIEKRLNNLAIKTGRTKSFYIKEALLEYLSNMEGVYLAEKRLEDLKSGKSKTYTLEEAKKELGL